MKSVTIALVTLTCLTACTTEPSRALPDIVAYDQLFLDKMHKEIRTEEVPALTEAMKDYKIMRDQTRKLKEEN